MSAFMGEDIFEGIKGGAKFGAIIGGFRGLGGEDKTIYQLNMACHSNDVYNYFQFGTNIVAAFTGGVASNKTCFIAGTLIVTGYGLSKIENIKPGDLVLSTNVDTMETGYKKVLEKYVRKTRELVHIVVGGEEIVSTPDHPYFVVGRGFVNAGQLCIGSPLQNADGKILEVEQIYKEYLEEDEEVTVYNFQVEDWHTYHVGEMEVLVHNAGNYGEITDNHLVVSSEEATNLPIKGRPANSSADLLNPDGSVKQRRFYDELGRAKKDIDFNHSDDGTHNFPHEHFGDWSSGKPIRSK